MNIVDAIIIICIILGAMGGLRRGLIKETVYLVGILLVLIISFHLKDYLATFMYKYLPFFNFHGSLEGVSALNILVYELIAFLVVFSVIYLILRIILKLTGIIETILKATIILGFFSKIGGAVLGAIEGYIIVFIVLFTLNQPFLNIKGMDDSKIGNFILDNTPFMSKATEGIRNAVYEIDDLADKYKNNKKLFNDEAIKLFIKYDIISEDNIDLLKEKGKLN